MQLVKQTEMNDNDNAPTGDDDNNKREAFLRYMRNHLLVYGEKERLHPKIGLAAWHELDCALIYELRSTYHFTN
jgi:hypothetical protein